jgi:DNA-binding PadR family transcriptional regulator
MSPRRASALTLEHVLLALLDQKSMHGYELYQELCKMKGISLIWNIKQALLYAILDKLEGRGFLSSQVVKGETYPPRKYFHLTAQGKSSLQTWMRTPVRRARDIRQEFLAKLIIARRYGKPQLLELIHLQQQTCQTWWNELQTQVSPPDQASMEEGFVISFRLNRVEGVLKWLQVLESEVEQLPDEPTL